MYMSYTTLLRRNNRTGLDLLALPPGAPWVEKGDRPEALTADHDGAAKYDAPKSIPSPRPIVMPDTLMAGSAAYSITSKASRHRPLLAVAGRVPPLRCQTGAGDPSAR